MNDSVECIRCGKVINEESNEAGGARLSKHWGLCPGCRGMDEFEDLAHELERRDIG